MQTLKLDEYNNLLLVEDDLKVIDGIEACVQDTRTRIGICRGEDPYNVKMGVDYFNEVLGKMGGEDYIRDQISSQILDDDEIQQINSLIIKKEQDVVTVQSEISSIYGVFTL